MATNNTTKTVTVDINSKVNSDLSNQLKILQSLFDTMNKSIMNINKSIGSYFSNISKEAKETAKAVKEVTNEVDKADEKEKKRQEREQAENQKKYDQQIKSYEKRYGENARDIFRERLEKSRFNKYLTSFSTSGFKLSSIGDIYQSKLTNASEELRALESEQAELLRLQEFASSKNLPFDKEDRLEEVTNQISKKEGFITNLKFASGVITTLTKGFGKFNSTLYALTGISVKVSDVFKNILGDMSNFIKVASTSDFGTSLITSSSSRSQQLRYGLTGAQNFALSQTMSMLGISGEEDLMYMNTGQRALFTNYMEKYINWYNEVSSSGVLQDIQLMQLDFKMFRQELAMDLLNWISQNKDTIMDAVKATISAAKWIAEILLNIIKFFGNIGTGLFGGSSSVSIDSANATMTSDRLLSGYSSTNNSKSVSISMSNTISGSGDVNSIREELNNFGDRLVKETSLALGN